MKPKSRGRVNIKPSQPKDKTYQGQAGRRTRFAVDVLTLGNWIEAGRGRGYFRWQLPNHLVWVLDRDYVDWRRGIMSYNGGRGWTMTPNWRSILAARFKHG